MYVCECENVSMCVCECVSMCKCVWVCEHVCVGVCMSMYVCECEHVCVCGSGVPSLLWEEKGDHALPMTVGVKWS